MSTSESPDSDPRPGAAAPGGPPGAPPAQRALILPPGPPLQAPEETRHIHQHVAVRIEETPDALMVTRTETILEHRHAAERADSGERRPLRARPHRQPPQRDGGPRSATAGGSAGFITFGSKSRIPAQLPRTQLVAYLNQERRLALDMRDPLAISFAAERYNAIVTFLQEAPETDIVDLSRPVLSVSQAAKILGYNAKEVRRLLGQGKIIGRKVGSEWRIPLRAVL